MPKQQLTADFASSFILKRLGFPQGGFIMYWYDTGVTDKSGNRITKLIWNNEVDDKAPHMYYAAPTSEELAMLAPSRYFTMKLGAGFMLVDFTKTKIEKGPPIPNEKTNGAPEHSMTFKLFRIKEADADSETICWTNGFIHLLRNKMINLKRKKKT